MSRKSQFAGRAERGSNHRRLSNSPATPRINSNRRNNPRDFLLYGEETTERARAAARTRLRRFSRRVHVLHNGFRSSPESLSARTESSRRGRSTRVTARAGHEVRRRRVGRTIRPEVVATNAIMASVFVIEPATLGVQKRRFIPDCGRPRPCTTARACELTRRNSATSHGRFLPPPSRSIERWGRACSSRSTCPVCITSSRRGSCASSRSDRCRLSTREYRWRRVIESI